jgi:hypothetical protein
MNSILASHFKSRYLNKNKMTREIKRETCFFKFFDGRPNGTNERDSAQKKAYAASLPR